MTVLLEDVGAHRRRNRVSQRRLGRSEAEDLRVAHGARNVGVFGGVGHLRITHVWVFSQAVQ